METKSTKNHIGTEMNGQRRETIEAMLSRALGEPGQPQKPLRELRREVSTRLKGISVSGMILKDR